MTKARGSLPNEEAVFKLLYLARPNIAKEWTMSVQNWKVAGEKSGEDTLIITE